MLSTDSMALIRLGSWLPLVAGPPRHQSGMCRLRIKVDWTVVPVVVLVQGLIEGYTGRGVGA